MTVDEITRFAERYKRVFAALRACGWQWAGLWNTADGRNARGEYWLTRVEDGEECVYRLSFQPKSKRALFSLAGGPAWFVNRSYGREDSALRALLLLHKGEDPCVVRA